MDQKRAADHSLNEEKMSKNRRIYKVYWHLKTLLLLFWHLNNFWLEYGYTLYNLNFTFFLDIGSNIPQNPGRPLPVVNNREQVYSPSNKKTSQLAVNLAAMDKRDFVISLVRNWEI